MGMRTTQRDTEFRDFYFAEAASLRRLALLVGGDPASADDIAQEALLRAYRAWPRIKNEDPGPYVRQVLVNICRSAHKRKLLEIRKRPTPQADVATREPDIDEALRVARALSVLSPIRRAVVVLRFYEDMTEPEIAHVLDRPLNTVKSDLRRSLERLRPELNEGVTAS